MTPASASTGDRFAKKAAIKLIVFHEGRYAIFEAYELVILCGRPVAMPRGVPETITCADILRKYGAALE